MGALIGITLLARLKSFSKPSFPVHVVISMGQTPAIARTVSGRFRQEKQGLDGMSVTGLIIRTSVR
jgi:hypothetical protein